MKSAEENERRMHQDASLKVIIDAQHMKPRDQALKKRCKVYEDNAFNPDIPLDTLCAQLDWIGRRLYNSLKEAWPED